MSVLVVGVSHRSAPVSVLEQVALDGDEIAKVARQALDTDHVTESLVVSTCNRVEIYVEAERFHGSVEDISDLLVERSGLTRNDLLRHIYVHYDDAAVAHLFSVAAGLDSMVVGESQILGQVRTALPAWPGRRHRRPCPERPLPAGAAHRQARARRDRHRPGGPLAGRRVPRARRQGRSPPRGPACPRRGRRCDGVARGDDRGAPRRGRGQHREPHPRERRAARCRRRRHRRPPGVRSTTRWPTPTSWSRAPAPPAP